MGREMNCRVRGGVRFGEREVPFEPVFRASILTGKVELDRRAEKWPGTCFEKNRKVGRKVEPSRDDTLFDESGDPIPVTMANLRKWITKEMLAECEANGITGGEAARKYGVTEAHIYRLRREYGLAKSRKRAAPPRSAELNRPEPGPELEPKSEPETSPEAEMQPAVIAPAREAPRGLHIADQGNYSAEALYKLLGGLAVFLEHQEGQFELHLEIRREVG